MARRMKMPIYGGILVLFLFLYHNVEAKKGCEMKFFGPNTAAPSVESVQKPFNNERLCKSKCRKSPACKSALYNTLNSTCHFLKWYPDGVMPSPGHNMYYKFCQLGCGPPPTIEGADPPYYTEEQTIFGMRIQYACTTGPVVSVICEASGKWEPTPVCGVTNGEPTTRGPHTGGRRRGGRRRCGQRRGGGRGGGGRGEGRGGGRQGERRNERQRPCRPRNRNNRHSTTTPSGL